MKVFLTGASGFIGRHLVKKLVKENCEVIAAVRSSTDKTKIPSGCKIVTIDFFSVSDFSKHLSSVDVVFHLAGAVKASSSEEFDKTNAGITAALVNAIKETTPKALFIFMSTQAAAGPNGTNPLSSYGKSKLLAEQVTTKLSRYVIVRSPAALGNDDAETESFYQWARRGITIALGNSKLKFCVIAISDITDFLVYLLSCTEAEGKILQPSLPNLVSWKEIHKALEKATNRRILRIPIPSFIVYSAGFLGEGLARLTGKLPLLDREKARDISVSWLCKQKEVEELTGWKPKHDLNATIKLSVQQKKS